MKRPASSRRLIAAAMAVVALQIVCALVFTLELTTDVFGLRHWALGWQAREAIQLAAVLGLILGAVAGILCLREMTGRVARAEHQLRIAAGALQEAVEDQFDAWALTPSERDVALFALKGFGNAEIAQLRGTSEATVKTQINAVFRKADVTSRAQLMAQFMDLLIAPPPATEAETDAATAPRAPPEPAEPKPS